MMDYKAACHTLSNDYFNIYEDMLKIILMLKVLFIQGSKVEDLYCGAFPGSKPGPFFSNSRFGLEL